MIEQSEGLAVRQSIVVDAPPERAFAVFTDGFATWWPVQTHTIGASPASDVVIEPRAGGRWFERGQDGSECSWGRVVTWEPPHRLVLSWQISADWQPDASVETEIEVRFGAAGDGRTRVELEHRGLESFGARANEMRETFGSEGGWKGLLARYAKAAGA
jgi:uncharacterized protein YndB with AHSA1/START domain